MGYTQDFLNDCRANGIDRRVWLVIDGQLYIAPDPIANHEDLFSLVTESKVPVDFNWLSAPKGDIMNAVARVDVGGEEWLGAAQEEFDALVRAGLEFELLGPDMRQTKTLD